MLLRSKPKEERKAVETTPGCSLMVLFNNRGAASPTRPQSVGGNWEMIRRFHDSLFAGHLGVSRICLERKSACPRRAPMGHVAVGHRWDRVAMDMMAYRSSVHETTGFRPYRLMFGEECTLPMDIRLPRQDPEPPDAVSSPFAVWVWDALEVAFDQVRRHSCLAVQRQKRLCDHPPKKKC